MHALVRLEPYGEVFAIDVAKAFSARLSFSGTFWNLPSYILGEQLTRQLRGNFALTTLCVRRLLGIEDAQP